MTAPLSSPPLRPDPRFLLRHPAHLVALGFGSGLSRWAPGTVGTLWAWVTFAMARPWMDDAACGWTILAASLLGWWACTRTAENLRIADPGAIVWDEVVAFWIVLWIVTPAGYWSQLAAFVLFRFFDAAKPGPVAWADAAFKDNPQPWARGFGILFDDLVAAGCTLLTLAVARALWEGVGLALAGGMPP